MKRLFTLKTLFTFLLVGSMAALTSCGKTKDSIAKITVLDSAGNPVANTTVLLKPESSDPNETREFMWESVEATTDAKGVATFNFTEDFKAGSAGLLVLTIDVPPYESVGIIKVVEEEVNEKTVELP